MDALSLKDVQLGFVYILLSNFKMTDVVFIYFGLQHFHRKLSNEFSILTRIIK